MILLNKRADNKTISFVTARIRLMPLIISVVEPAVKAGGI